MPKKAKKKRPGLWIDQIAESIGRPVRLETTDGSNREGRLSGLRYREMIVNGKPLDVMIALELNGDPSDFIDFHIIRRLDID